MMSDQNAYKQALQFVRKQGMVRPRDLESLGIQRMVISRLVEQGELVRRSRGIYTLPDYEPTEHTHLAEVALRIPKAAICLLSALRFHEMTTQNPFQIWIMMDKASRKPRLEYPPLRIVRASGQALTAGLEVHRIEGVKVSITNPAKTVVDCFRYRRRVGLDIALEALKQYRRERRGTMDDLYRFAKIDRVAPLMSPYMDALLI